jgi:hypothetical protein
VDILDEAGSVAAAADRSAALERIASLLDKHPDSEHLFILVGEEGRNLILHTYASGEVEMQLYLAQMFINTIMAGIWKRVEDEQRET